MNEGKFDLAVFNLEQYCQLMLRYKLLLRKGTYPRTHLLRRMIRELGELNPKALFLVEELRNLHYIARLEEAYISSRYLPISYEEAEARDLLRFVLEVFKPVAENI